MKQPKSSALNGNNHGSNQVKSALVFFCAVGAVILAVSFFLSPLAPTAVFSVAARIRLSPIDVSDNGVSDYAPLKPALSGSDDFALSLLPDVPAGYTLAKDYLMFLNREMGVTKLLLNITSEAAELLNAGLIGVLDERYYALTAGSFCASVEFRDFVSLIRSLNIHLLPDMRIGFVGIADNPSEDYAEAAEKSGTLLLMSRDEAHGQNGIGSILSKKTVLADVFYVSASTSLDAKVTDLLLPVTAKGYYFVSGKDVEGIRGYYRFTMKFNKKEIGAGADMIASDSPFFFVAAGGIADSAEEEQTDAEGDGIDYGV